MASQLVPPGRMLKIGEVIEQTSLSRRSIYRLMRAGQFPKSRKLSPQRVAWSEGEVEAWKQSLQDSSST